MYFLFIARRYLVRRVTSYLAVLGVAIGVMVLIVVGSIMDGFQKGIKANIRGTLAHITVFYTGGEWDTGAVMDALEALSDEIGIAGVTRRVEGWVLLDQGGDSPEALQPCILVGVDPRYERNATDFDRYLRPARQDPEDPFSRPCPPSVAEYLEGKRDSPFPTSGPGGESVRPGILIGRAFQLYRLGGVRPGDRLTLITVPRIELSSRAEEGNEAAPQLRPKTKLVTVAGVYDTGEFDYAMQHLFMEYEEARRYLETPHADQFLVKLKDYRATERARDQIQVRLDQWFGPGFFYVRTWQDLQRTLLEAIRVERALIVILLFMVFVVAAFMIWALLHTLVRAKYKDIGILKSVGATRAGVMAAFLTCGLLIGLMGALTGSLLGYLTTIHINDIERGLHALTGIQFFPRDIYIFKDIPYENVPQWYAFVAASGLVIAVLSAILPAWRASRLPPVEALRYE